MGYVVTTASESTSQEILCGHSAGEVCHPVQQRGRNVCPT